MACWCYRTALSILVLNTDLAIVPGYAGDIGDKEIWLIDW